MPSLAQILDQYFDVAFAAPDGMKKLRELILSPAMQGKLVPQDPSDRSARELLKKIEAEKSRLVKDGKIKPSKPLPEIKPNEVPYDMPKSWEWVRLGDLATFINGDRGKNYPSKDLYVFEGIPFINAGHLVNGLVDWDEMNYISKERFGILGSGKVKNNDILYCLRGSLGKTAVVKDLDRGAIASSLVIIRLYQLNLVQFTYHYLTSPFGKEIILLMLRRRKKE
ncbi:MAG: hypothetical protein DCF20_13800 [Pseudanabaena sp.]|nr:MAG: hypothetical protein DCF20_13800 [Pseudanabaena sp.]